MLRSAARLASVFAILCPLVGVHAAPFAPVIDEFWIVKGTALAGPTEIFRDAFSDSVVPPSGPDGVTTYGVFGPGGMTNETGGKLTMTPSSGAAVLISSGFADMATVATRALATNSANANFLGLNSSFEIHGLYDLSVLPGIAGQGFGIRATDRAPPLSNEGNNTVQLNVGVDSGTGDVSVILRFLDFAANTSTLIEIVSIEALLPGADQIELILSKALDSSQVAASFKIYDYDTSTTTTGSLTNTLTIYDGEDYIRGAFVSLDKVPVPAPGTLALFGLGLAGLGLARRRLRSKPQPPLRATLRPFGAAVCVELQGVTRSRGGLDRMCFGTKKATSPRMSWPMREGFSLGHSSGPVSENFTDFCPEWPKVSEIFTKPIRHNAIFKLTL